MIEYPLTWREIGAISMILAIGVAYGIYYLYHWLRYRAMQRHHDKRIVR
jgi:predicted RND superfamily exporter protein